jgi:plastocyanin domain-containing protein
MMGLMPFDSNGTAYISGATGAFLFDNHHGIASEFHMSNGLIASQVNSIAFATDGSIWFATTLGLSVLKGVQNSVTSPGSPVTPSNIQSYPNPFIQSTTITFSSPESGVAEVTIVNLLGSQVARLFEGELAVGEHKFTWNANGITPGAYWAIVRMDGQVVQVPIVLQGTE